MKMQLLVQLFLLLFPWFIRRRLLNLFFNYQISSNSKVGRSFFAAKYLFIGDGVQIGSMNFFINLDQCVLEGGVRIGSRNRVTGGVAHGVAASDSVTLRDRSFRMGVHSALTHDHKIDCSESVNIGKFTTIAGWNSQFITHGINVETNSQEYRSINIGDYCLVGSRSLILAGSKLDDRCILGAGAVLCKNFSATNIVIAGIPPKIIGKTSKDHPYFSRKKGAVD